MRVSTHVTPWNDKKTKQQQQQQQNNLWEFVSRFVEFDSFWSSQFFRSSFLILWRVTVSLFRGVSATLWVWNSQIQLW